MAKEKLDRYETCIYVKMFHPVGRDYTIVEVDSKKGVRTSLVSSRTGETLKELIMDLKGFQTLKQQLNKKHGNKEKSMQKMQDDL